MNPDRLILKPMNREGSMVLDGWLPRWRRCGWIIARRWLRIDGYGWGRLGWMVADGWLVVVRFDGCGAV